jgi:hypothetical protein
VGQISYCEENRFCAIRRFIKIYKREASMQKKIISALIVFSAGIVQANEQPNRGISEVRLDWRDFPHEAPPKDRTYLTTLSKVKKLIVDDIEQGKISRFSKRLFGGGGFYSSNFCTQHDLPSDSEQFLRNLDTILTGQTLVSSELAEGKKSCPRSEKDDFPVEAPHAIEVRLKNDDHRNLRAVRYFMGRQIIDERLDEMRTHLGEMKIVTQGDSTIICMDFTGWYTQNKVLPELKKALDTSKSTKVSVVINCGNQQHESQ